jgi:hypothetical protein
MSWGPVCALLNDPNHCRVITPVARRRLVFLTCFVHRDDATYRPSWSVAGPWLVRGGRRFVVNGSGRLLAGHG